MSAVNVENLSDQQRACLEHLRQAQELGVSFSQYCRQRDLKHDQWYWVKRELVRKGVIAGGRKAKEAPKAGVFAPVRIVPSAAGPSSPAVACRLVHPSGWVIECAGWPPAGWMTTVLCGGAHAAA